MFRNRPLLTLFLVTTVAIALSSSGEAQIVSWDDGGGGNSWLNIFNWDPDVALSSTNDVFIGDLASAAGDQTELDSDVTIQSLVLTNDTGVHTNGHQLQVLGNAGIELGDGTSFTVVDSASGQLEAVNLKVRDGASMNFEGGSVELVNNATTDSGGELRGYGFLEFTQSAAVNVFNNDGLLRTARDLSATLDERFTLTLVGNSAGNAQLDLDGLNGTGEILLVNNTTLSLLNMNLADFGGTLEMREGSVLTSTNTFRTKAGAQITVNGAQGAAGADTATIDGTNFVANSANIDVNSGKLVVASNAFSMDAAAVMNVADGSEVQFNNDATIDGRLSMTNAAQLTVNGNVTVNDPTFNWDGSASRASTTVNSGGQLTINTSSIDGDEVFGENGSQINLNDGALTANVDSLWTMAGELNMSSPTGSAELDGTSVSVTGSITANGGGVSRIRAPITFQPGSSTHVEAGSDLSIIADVEFEGGTTHTGDGNIRTARDILVSSSGTVIDMPNGTFELDNRNGDQNLEMFYDLELNVDSLGGEVGDLNGGDFIIDLHGGTPTLTVNLSDPDAEWTLGESGTVNFSSNLTLEGAIAGSDLNVKGRMFLDGGSTAISARLDIENTGLIDVQGGELRLDGGTEGDPNRLLGGTIAGTSGSISVTPGGPGLAGYGNVQPTVRFLGGADLIASGGTLNVARTIEDADLVGAESGALLNLGAPLDTGNITALEMMGGIVSGSDIQNTGTIRGFGTIWSDVINNGQLVASGGGQLSISSTGLFDLDGANEAGVIHAQSADLVIFNPAMESFDGEAIVDAGFAIDVQENWILSPNSLLRLEGSDTATATLRGPFASIQGEVFATGQSRLEVDGLFFPTSTITLPNANDVLSFADSATFLPGAAVVGNGKLDNLVGSELLISGTASIDAPLRNAGEFGVFGNSPGTSTVEDFRQTSSGTTTLRLFGSQAGEYDQLFAVEDIVFDGNLEIELLYSAAVGDEFTLLQAENGMVDLPLTALRLPILPGTLTWHFDSTDPREFVLSVVDVPLPGDFDGDGDYACADVDQLVAQIVSGTSGGVYDLNGDGLVNAQDLEAWLSVAGAAELASGNAYLSGDANLDGTVDGLDFIEWNNNKFTNTAAYCSGDFNADGTVDGLDFIVWNGNKFTSADAISAVPEPAAAQMLIAAALIMSLRRRCRRVRNSAASC